MIDSDNERGDEQDINAAEDQVVIAAEFTKSVKGVTGYCFNHWHLLCSNPTKCKCDCHSGYQLIRP